MLEISPQVFKLPTTEVVYSDDTKSVKQARRLRQQQRHKFCISDNEKQQFCTLCTCIFQDTFSFFSHWKWLQLCGRREHMMTNVQFFLFISEALVSV